MSTRKYSLLTHFTAGKLLLISALIIINVLIFLYSASMVNAQSGNMPAYNNTANRNLVSDDRADGFSHDFALLDDGSAIEPAPQKISFTAHQIVKKFHPI
jgi:hypothetical protein